MYSVNKVGPWGEVKGYQNKKQIFLFRFAVLVFLVKLCYFVYVLMSIIKIYNVLFRTLNGLMFRQWKRCSSLCQETKCWNWDVSKLITKELRVQTKYAVLVLNRPITQSNDFMQCLWNNANVRITVDGGTLQWEKFLSSLPIETKLQMKLPDLITGDFDSIPAELLDKYKKQGCKVLRTPDQDYTDFTKALMELNSYCKIFNTELDSVFAIGQSSGRIDHSLGNIQTLFLAKEKKLVEPSTSLYLMSDDSLSWLLYPGNHVINIPESVRRSEKLWCSLIPVGETCANVTTSGLKWDLCNGTLKFGDLVSTSNTFSGAEKVKIKCSHTVLWSMRIPNLFGDTVFEVTIAQTRSRRGTVTSVDIVIILMNWYSTTAHQP